MAPKWNIVLIILLFMFVTEVSAQYRESSEKIPMPKTSTATDTTIVESDEKYLKIEESQNVRKFYDSIRSRTSGSGFSKLFYSTLFRSPTIVRDEKKGKFIYEVEYYEPYRNRTIGEVMIWRSKMYGEDVSGFRNFANKVHVLTMETTIKRDLQFESGDLLDPEQIVRDNQLLRTRSYLANAEIEVIPRTTDTMIVDIIVYTQDKWTISMDGSWRDEGRTMFEVYDANIFGTGNKLSIKTHLNRKNFDYRGNVFQYNIQNLGGLFYRVHLFAGKSFDDQRYSVSLRKDFMKPTDYDIGLFIGDEHRDYYQLYVDSSAMVKTNYLSLWGGKSFFIKNLKSSIYITTKYDRIRFRMRPDTPEQLGREINPAFHDADNILLGIGLYRERFVTTNMIYGFGNREYLATGYKTELVSGYTWGEFSNDIYLGINMSKSGFSPMGYFMGGFTLGSYVNPSSGAWERSGIDVDLHWISNLWGNKRGRVRQFLSLNYTHGWNRWRGNNEVIGFTRENGPKTISEWMVGTTRLVLNTETVLFTPWQPLGFNIAFFGFADFGMLGFDPNSFKNAFCTTLGFGIRLKNERFVFKTIQLRFGLAIGKNGLMDNRYIWLSNEQRMNQYRFIPSYPEIVRFK